MPVTDPYLTDPLNDDRVVYAPVISSNVHSIGYKVETHTLFVAFKDKVNPGQWASKYAYLDVPSHVYLDLTRAASKGKFLGAVVKGQYVHQRIA